MNDFCMPQGPTIVCTVDGICYSADAIRRIRAENAKLLAAVEGMAEQLKAQQAAYARVVAQNQQDREA
jgi:hypothetical protein